MSRVLILLPQAGFDPTEVAVPWKALVDAGHEVIFATETGAEAACDPVTLTGQGLPVYARFLRAHEASRALYADMAASPAFRTPVSWADVIASDYALIHFPGGHAPDMRPYLESALVQDVARAAFAAGRPVSAICHGVVALARAGVLKGYRTTALTAIMENVAVWLTRGALGLHYRTYPQGVEEEVRAALARPEDFARGPILGGYATRERPSAGFIVRDRNYVSARWPGDAWTLAAEMLRML